MILLITIGTILICKGHPILGIIIFIEGLAHLSDLK
jgi:hypothetical protein